MKMIKVGVRDEHDIHRRKIAQAQPGPTKSFQNEKPAGKVGIDNYVHPADLQEEAGVADKRDTQIAICNQLRLMGLAGARGDSRVSHQSGKLSSSST